MVSKVFVLSISAAYKKIGRLGLTFRPKFLFLCSSGVTSNSNSNSNDSSSSSDSCSCIAR